MRGVGNLTTQMGIRMSRLGEFIAWHVNQIFPRLTIHYELKEGERTTETNQAWSYNEAANIVFAFKPYWDLKGKHILDIGTGLGGKQPFYIEAGARTITGIDIDPQNVRVTKEHITRLGVNKRRNTTVMLVVSDAAAMPFSDNTFDAIVSINVFEHIQNLETAVQETFRVLKPGGIAYLHLPPYYGPWGPHLENWIHFPWPHLFFSDQTMLRVAAREDAHSQLSSQLIPAARIDWESTTSRVPNVNKVTFHKFHKTVKEVGFTILQLKLLPVGYQRVNSSESWVERLALQIIGLGIHLPIIQEAIITKMVFVLTKTS